MKTHRKEQADSVRAEREQVYRDLGVSPAKAASIAAIENGASTGDTDVDFDAIDPKYKKTQVDSKELSTVK